MKVFGLLMVDFEDESTNQFASHDGKTRDIENLHRHNYFAQPIAIEEEETDQGFDSWSQIRPSGRLWDLCEQIGMYRREGKNRRDTSTVAIRVLRLAQFASNWNGSKKGKMKPVQQVKL